MMTFVPGDISESEHRKPRNLMIPISIRQSAINLSDPCLYSNTLWPHRANVPTKTYLHRRPHNTNDLDPTLPIIITAIAHHDSLTSKIAALFYLCPNLSRT